MSEGTGSLFSDVPRKGGTQPLDAESVRLCLCEHQEWQHVWTMTPVPFSAAPCSVEGCWCEDWVDKEGAEAMCQ